jgi:hypothetical protein
MTGGARAGVARSWLDAYLAHRFAWLFASLLLTLGVDPVLEALGSESRWIEALLLLNLLVACSAADSRAAVRVLLGATLLAAAAWLALGPGSGEVALGLVALLLSAVLLREVLRRGRVDAERLFAALSVYLLFGVAVGVLYAVLERALPGSISGIVDPATGTVLPDAAIYFSFVTLATLGYGDLVPTHSAARALAVLEAVGGQIYLTVLVARLVTLYGWARER